MEDNSVTVTEINRYINNKMKLDDKLTDIYVRGEISNFKTWPTSGHSYFTLKDENSQIPAVMWSSYKEYLKFEPKDGMKVIVHGKIEVYETKGQYQLQARSIKEDGFGDLYIAFEQLKKKLKEEGLFEEDHKKKIPRYPEKIGVVTAANGAAVKDIIITIKRRYPICEILVFPTLVQGDLAKHNIVSQIKHAQEYDLDTLIVGRGGGSIEDLWPFNEEIVAREIYECEIPVISAVGHEIDFTISDFVADLRAATPTAAAERSVPDINEIKSKIQQYNDRINYTITNEISKNRDKLNEISRKRIFKEPESMYNVKKMDLDHICKRFNSASKNILSENKNKLTKLENSIVLKNPNVITKNKKDKFIRNLGKLEVLNPLLTLKRGYTITKMNDKIISSTKDVETGDELEIEFDDGSINAKVI